MNPSEPLTIDTIGGEGPFSFIKPEEFDSLGINPEDIPPGTFVSLKHPTQIPSRFGGNAYGFGFFEVYTRLNKKDLELLQAVSLEDPDHIRPHYREINRIYKDIGLLIRFSSQGRPYYLVPANFVSGSLAHIKTRADEISKIIRFHGKKYLKERYRIGLLTQRDDLVVNDLSLRFKELNFVLVDSIERLRSLNEEMDIMILTRDIHEIILAESFNPWQKRMPSKRKLREYARYVVHRIYRCLAQDGEIFMMANRHPLKSRQTIEVRFQTPQEEKNFLLFSHIFKTSKRYVSGGKPYQVNIYDLQKYLSGMYVGSEVLDRLMDGRRLEDLGKEELDQLPYLNFSPDDGLSYDQIKVWSDMLSTFFKEIFLKPLLPEAIKTDWQRRFRISNGYSPHYMLIYLGEKRPPESGLSEIRKDVTESRLSGCPLNLLADYRDSFTYLIRTLKVLKGIKRKQFSWLPEVFMDQLREPLVNKKRRYPGLNHILTLISKIHRLEKIESSLNPDKIEGPKTRLLSNLEILSLSGFGYGELKEIFLVTVGHTAMGRVLAGKMNEKALKPVSDMARSLDPQQAMNLLSYCRLMSMAETVASKKSGLTVEQLVELFDLYDSMVRVVTNREIDWEQLLDESISSIGGIHNKIVRKILKMMNHFEFLNNWPELPSKGIMEKEVLADYNEANLAKIDNAIRLVEIINQFEGNYLEGDPLEVSAFYRKFLDMEFHGTGHLFERMDSRGLFSLLWVTVNLATTEIINFNPILAGVNPSEIDSHVRRVEAETRFINENYLDLPTLRRFREQLDENRTSFIVGTGFQLKVNQKTQALDINYINMNENIERLEQMAKEYKGCQTSDIPVAKLEEMEVLFENLNSFYMSHLRLLSQGESGLRLPGRQKKWFEKVKGLRETLKSNFVGALFHPESIYTDLELLYSHCPSLLEFVLPEFMELKDLKLAGKVYLKSPVLAHILKSTKKIQALIRHEKGAFQDVEVLHKVAQLEFGPMAAGIVGLNESQIETLENMIEGLRSDQPLFDAFVKSFIFRDIGLSPTLRKKYGDEVNIIDHAQAGAYFLERERIPERYNIGGESRRYLVDLVRYHDFIHHMVRGEFSIYATQELLDLGQKNFFDAFFISSFIMFSSMREDLVLEDLATQLYSIRNICQDIMEGKMTLDEHIEEICSRRGHLFFALEEYQKKGLPPKGSSVDYFASSEWEKERERDYIEAGKKIYALERILRLRGIRYVEFRDLASLIVKVPLRFIYQKRNYRGVGYPTFERELFEALRMYNGLKSLPPDAQDFILEHLIRDEVRLYGFENVSSYMNYENIIKLLLIALMGGAKFKESARPVCISFLGLAEKIARRYEALNETLNNISVEKLWGNPYLLNHFFRAKTGLVLAKEDEKGVLTVDFVDRINVHQKISYMKSIGDLEQLKNYFHYSLRTLRKNPFHTEDYEKELERAFEGRFREITDMMLERVKGKIESSRDFKEIQGLANDLMDRSLDIGFTDEQKHRLMDLYELRKDQLKREKLEEIEGFLATINETQELKDYWDSIKWYLSDHRPYFGKEFENLIARKFDEKMGAMGGGPLMTN